MDRAIFFVIFTSAVVKISKAYNVPAAEFKIFYPKGFTVSIPAEEGVTLYAFHGQINDKIDGSDMGDWSKDVIKPRNGRFAYRERDAILKLGDVIYYWAFVLHNGRGYRVDNGAYVVTHYTAPPWMTSVNTTQDLTIKSNSNSFKQVSSNCRRSITTINQGIQITCTGQMIFEDNFEGHKLDKNKWLMERRFSSQPDYEFVLYLPHEEVLKVCDGLVTIKPIALTRIYGNRILRDSLSLGHNCTGIFDTEDCRRPSNTADILPPFISSQFTTKKHFSFKYGTVEVRAKMPNAEWVFPQIFLEPVDAHYGLRSYQSGQMRIAFSRSSSGNFVNELFGGVVLFAQGPFRSEYICKRTGQPIDWSADFHIYTLEWLPGKISIRVDGDLYCRVQPPVGGFAKTLVNGRYLPNKTFLEAGSNMAPFDQEFYIKLGYGIGGHNDFPDDAALWTKKKPWVNSHSKAMRNFWRQYRNSWNRWLNSEAAFQVDYVRVYSV